MNTIVNSDRPFEATDFEIQSELGIHPPLSPQDLFNSIASERRGYLFLKRSLDILASACLMFLFAAPALLVAAAIRLESQGPVFFSQTRCGTNGREFKFWKFRSMANGAEETKATLTQQADKTSAHRFKMTKDPRVTRVGGFIRKYSIDELPQLLNVLRGDMSLVGPRPPLPSEVELYTDYDHRRLTVKPGITCTWQISGRSDIPFHEQVEMDLDYIAKSSLWMDLEILLKTPVAVLTARGAY